MQPTLAITRNMNIRKGVVLLTNIAGFDIALSAVFDVPGTNDHPFMTIARFIFADDRPNGNKQVVAYSEFPNVIKTAIGMPVKMRYLEDDDDVGDHAESIPIGVIQKMEEQTANDGSHQLVAEAVLWHEEFPEEVQYLREAFAEGKAPGISYELGYNDSQTVSGLQFIRNVVTLAATFVKHPAYGKRTQLLALAEDENASNESKPVEKGGYNMEEELKQAIEEAKQSTALASSLASEIEALKAQNAEKDQALATAQEEISAMKLANLIDTRTRLVVEAGLTLEANAEKAERKKALWASLTEEQFTEYLSDLVAAKQSAVAAAPIAPGTAALALASLQTTVVPRLETAVEQGNYDNLKDAMRSLARPNSVE